MVVQSVFWRKWKILEKIFLWGGAALGNPSIYGGGRGGIQMGEGFSYITGRVMLCFGHNVGVYIKF